MPRVFVDTNVFLRFLTQDEPARMPALPAGARPDFRRKANGIGF